MGQVLVFALVSAAIYAIAASGLVVTYTTSGIFNFAHGAIAMISAYVYWQLSSPNGWDLPVWLSLGLTLLVFAPLLGAFLDWLIMRRIVDAGPLVRIVVPIGLLVALISIASIVWPPDRITNARLPDFFPGSKITVADVAISYHQLVVLACAIGVALGLRVLLYNTRTGVAMRAVVESSDLASLNGAKPARISALSWAIGCSLAALAGILIAPLLTLDQVNLTLLVINAFAAAMVGRLRSLPLTFLGAFLLGLAIELVRKYASQPPSWLPIDWPWWLDTSTVPVVMLFVVLLVVPQDKAAVFEVSIDRSRIPTVSRRSSVVAAIAFVAFVAWLPSVTSGTILNAVATGLGLGLIAMSLVPLTGYAGQISLAPLAFAGIGALIMFDHGRSGNPLALLLVMGVCAGIGALIALPAIRLKGLYLALATMAFAFFCEKAIFARVGARQQRHAFAPLEFFGWKASSQRAQLIVLGVTIALVGLLITWIRCGPMGRKLQALKDSPAAASTIGLDLTAIKIGVFAFSAAIAGLGGALLGIWRGQWNSEQFSLLGGTLPGLPLVLMAVVGGIAAVAGVLLGGLLLAVMPQVGETYPALRDLMAILPGLAGIGLAANPSGAIAQTVDQVGAAIELRRNNSDDGEPGVIGRLHAALIPEPPALVPEDLPIGAPGPADSVLALLDAELGADQGVCDASS